MTADNESSQPTISRQSLRARRATAAAYSDAHVDVASMRATQTSGSPQEAALRPYRGTSDGRRGTILTVCTGNICRSPIGEVVLRASMTDVPVRVHSAGTRALVDHGMTDMAQEMAIALGADANASAAHRARFLEVPLLDESDILIAMTREHRSQVVRMQPAVLKRAFTLREFARLAATLSDADIRAAADGAGPDSSRRLQAVALAVGTQRGLTHVRPEDDDVVDPYRQSRQVYEESAAQIAPAITEIARVTHAALV